MNDRNHANVSEPIFHVLLSMRDQVEEGYSGGKYKKKRISNRFLKNLQDLLTTD